MKNLRTKTSLRFTNRIEKKELKENLMQAAATYFVLLAVFSAYFSVFDMGIPVSRMAVSLGISSLFLLLIMRSRGQQMKVWLAGGILLVVTGVILGKSLYGGVSSYVNKFLELYNQYYANQKQMLVAESTQYSSIIALCYLGVMLGFVFFVVLDKKKGLLFSIFIITLPIILAAVVGKMPLQRNWWILITAACFYLFVYRQSQGQLELKGTVLVAGTLAGVIIISTIVQPMVLDYKNLHLEEYKKIRKELMNSQEKNMDDWKDVASDLANPTMNFSGGISKGELSKNASVNPTGEVAMEIVMTERPVDTIYLRGYVASEYTGDSWEEISAGELSEILPRVGGAEKKRELFNEPFRRVAEGDYEDFLGDLSVPQITIKLVNASKEFGYAPYCAEVTNEYDVHKDSYVEGKLSKTRTYSFYPLSFDEGNDYQNYLLDFVYQYVISGPGYEQNGFSEFWGLELGEESELWTAYQEFVKDAYTDNHRELPKLREFCESIDQYNIEGELLYYFESKCYYSRNPGEMPADLDFAEGFMFGRKVGFCVHFATAATLVYQMCGYPARYVEGYAVSASDFTRYEDGTYHATVTDESAHAWCEVFDDELGWVAKEFTPATRQIMYPSEGNDEPVVEDDSWDDQLNEENSDDVSQNIEENVDNSQINEENVDNLGGNEGSGGISSGESEENESGTSDNDAWRIGKKILWTTLQAVCVVLLSIIIIVFQQKIRRAKRLKSFRQKKNNKGVLSIYNAIYELCVFAGFRTEKVNERARLEEIVIEFPQLTESEWNRLYMWAEKAAFSNEKLSSDVQKEMYHLYRRFRNEILKTLSFKKKTFFRYIRAL